MPSPAPSKETVSDAVTGIIETSGRPGFSLDIEQIAALRSLQAHDGPLTEVRRLLARGAIRKADVEVLFAQARLVGRAAAPVILDMLFEKATRGEDCPYDLDALTFLAKGFGVVSPNKPVDDLERAQSAVDATRIAAMTDQELVQSILSKVHNTHAAARAAKAEERANRA